MVGWHGRRSPPRVLGEAVFQVMFTSMFRRPIVAMVAAATVVGVGVNVASAAGLFDNTPLGDKQLGLQADGSYLTQTNQFVTPVGDVIKENGRPFGLALSPDGKTAATLNNGGGTTGSVSVFDLVNHTLLQQTGTGTKSDGGVLYSADGTHLWAAQPTRLLRFDVGADGKLSNQVAVALPGVSGRSAVPAGLAWAPDGKLLVTLDANNTLGVLDTTTNTLTRQIPVGNVPSNVVVVGGKAYVSNLGGRPAQSGDKTDNSYGTPIVTNGNNSAISSTGTVSEVDLTSGTQVKTFKVGLQPNALLAVGDTVVVANSGDDTVTSIDTAKQQLGRTFSANPAPGEPFGASPNGLAMLDKNHLAVSLGRDNAVAIYDYPNAYTQPSFEGLTSRASARSARTPRTTRASAPTRRPATSATTSSARCRPSRHRPRSRWRTGPNRSSRTTSGSACRHATRRATGRRHRSPSRCASAIRRRSSTSS